MEKTKSIYFLLFFFSYLFFYIFSHVFLFFHFFFYSTFLLLFSSFFLACFFIFFFIFFLFFGVLRKEPVFLRTPDLTKQGFGLVLSPNSGPAERGFGQLFLWTRHGSYFKRQGSEFRERNLPFSEPRNLSIQGYTGSFSKLWTCRTRVIQVLSETPNSGQKHNPGPSWNKYNESKFTWIAVITAA